MDEEVEELFKELHELRRSSADPREGNLLDRHQRLFLTVASILFLATLSLAIWKLSGGAWNCIAMALSILVIIANLLTGVVFSLILCATPIIRLLGSDEKNSERSLREIRHNWNAARRLDSYDPKTRTNAEAHLNAIVGDATTFAPSSIAGVVFGGASLVLAVLTYYFPKSEESFSHPSLPHPSLAVMIVILTAVVVICGALIVNTARLNRYAYMRDMLVLARSLRPPLDQSVT
jgi:hypothetical protein